MPSDNRVSREVIGLYQFGVNYTVRVCLKMLCLMCLANVIKGKICC